MDSDSDHVCAACHSSFLQNTKKEVEYYQFLFIHVIVSRDLNQVSKVLFCKAECNFNKNIDLSLILMTL